MQNFISAEPASPEQRRGGRREKKEKKKLFSFLGGLGV
jgi:hypothetical protein